MAEFTTVRWDLVVEAIGVNGAGGSDLSEVGGEGGVGVSDAADEADLAVGVATVGDEAVVVGERSEIKECGLDEGATKGAGVRKRWRSNAASARRNLSCLISASTLRSESSSRNLCAAIRSDSRSCSPVLISSSNNTPRSMATLYLDSISSSDDVVFRACLSKSSFATSMSLNLSCMVLFESRSVVISFCKVFWAAFASILACLYFACTKC